MYRILISGYYGFGNTGDEAILLSIIENLKKYIGNVQITVLSANPDETTKSYQVRSIDSFDFIKIIKEIYKTDLVISGGGTLLQDITSFRNVPYYLSIIYLAKRIGKKVVLYSNGIGPINHRFNKYLVKWILNKVDLITVRDESSKKELESLGIIRPPIHVTADSAFALEPDLNLKKIDDIFSKKGANLQKPLIGISLRRWKDDEKFFKELADGLDCIKQKYDVEMVFIPMQKKEDLKAAEKLVSYLKSKIIVMEGDFSVKEWLDIISRMKMLIGMRLHSLIFAAITGVPMIGIIYDPKVDSFLNMVEQPSAGCVCDFDKNKLIRFVDEIFRGENQLNRKIVSELRDKAISNIFYLLNIIK